jgi:hypothetical protein
VPIIIPKIVFGASLKTPARRAFASADRDADPASAPADDDHAAYRAPADGDERGRDTQASALGSRRECQPDPPRTRTDPEGRPLGVEPRGLGGRDRHAQPTCGVRDAQRVAHAEKAQRRPADVQAHARDPVATPPVAGDQAKDDGARGQPDGRPCAVGDEPAACVPPQRPPTDGAMGVVECSAAQERARAGSETVAARRPVDLDLRRGAFGAERA